MSVSLFTIAALLVLAFAAWFIVYRVIWSPFSLYFTLKEGGAEEEAAGYSSFNERITLVYFTNVWVAIGLFYDWLVTIFFTVRDNFGLFVGLFLVMGASIFVATYQVEILEAVDEVWHDVVFPAYDDVIRPLLVALTDLFDVLIPWYNLFAAAIPDTIIFTVELLVECDLATWEESIEAFANIIVVFAEETEAWVIRVVNDNGADYNAFRLWKSIVAFIETLIDKVGCLCYELSWLWCTIFDILNSDNLAIAVDQFINSIFTLLDIIIDWIIDLITVDFNNNPIPDFAPSFNKLCNSSLALGSWITDITNIVISDFVDNSFTVPDFGILLGQTLCIGIRIAQAVFDLLANEYVVITDIISCDEDPDTCKPIQFLIEDYEYSFIFTQTRQLAANVLSVFTFWNVQLLSLIGCAVSELIVFLSYLVEFFADSAFALFAIGPQFFTEPKETAEQYLDFLRDYNFGPIYSSFRNSSFCTFGILGLANEDFACAGDNITNAVLTAVNITLELVLYPELVFTSGSFWRSLPFDQLFMELEDTFICLGDLLKSFASDPDNCPPHVVNTESDDDDDDVNFWCCSGNTVEGIGVAVVALAQTLSDILLNLIEGDDALTIAENVFMALDEVVIPQLEIGLDNLACVPLSLFEQLDCPESFSGIDDDDDEFDKVGEALEFFAIEVVNVTLIPFRFAEIAIGGFIVFESDDEDEVSEVLSFVCPGFDSVDSSNEKEECFVRGVISTSLQPFISFMYGISTVVGCFAGSTAQEFLKGIATIVSTLVEDIVSDVINIMVDLYDLIRDFFRRDWTSVGTDLANLMINIEDMFVQMLKVGLENLGDFLCNSVLPSFVCALRDVRDVEEVAMLYPDDPYFDKTEWTGGTRCDALVQNYERYVELGLEAVARAEISDCVLWKKLAQGINQDLNPFYPTPLIEDDLFYNPTRPVKFVLDLPKGLEAFRDWVRSGHFETMHNNTWKNESLIEAELKDLEYYMLQNNVRSRGVISFVKGVDKSIGAIVKMLRRHRGGSVEEDEAYLKKRNQRLLEHSARRSQNRALTHNSRKASQRQKSFERSRREVGEPSVEFYRNTRQSVLNVLAPHTDRAWKNRQQMFRMFTRGKRIVQRTMELRNMDPEEHARAKREMEFDVCGPLFDDDDDHSRFDCEDVCSLNCTGCNWLQDVFCQVYLDRFAEVLFRVRTGQVPCFNQSRASATPTPTPMPLITKIPPKSFTWEVFTFITRNIFGISDQRLIDTINDVGNFVINTNVDPDDGDVGLAGTIVGFFFCEYDELSACAGPGIIDGLFITFPIYLVITFLLSYVFTGSQWLLDFIWMTYIPVLLVISYEVGFFCYLRPLPNLPENIADDILAFADSVFTPFINWDNFLPGLLIVMGNMRTFVNCVETVGFLNWSDNLVFLLQWISPSFTNFLRDTDYFAIKWLRDLPFLGDSLSKEQFMFTGSPPDTETSCFIVTSLNWAGILFVTSIVALFAFISVFLAYLIFIALLETLTYIAYFGIETARQTRNVRKT